MNINTKMLAIVVSIVVLTIGIFVSSRKYHPDNSRATHSVATTSPSQTAVPEYLNQYASEISTNTSGQNVYINNKYSFQFTYPQGWRVGDNILGLQYGGTFSLFNYAVPEPGASSSGFTKGENKIEAVVINSSDSSAMLSSNSPDYPKKSSKPISLSLVGETAAGINVEFIGGEERRTFIVPLLSIPEKSLMISIYGDPSNFYVLDDLVKSITWK